MSASFYDFQKFAATGIASPEMTHYDKMMALAMAGGKVKTLTGVPPLSFKANGKPLISLSMLGNGVQNGTPSPQNIVPFDGTGERTGNLFDAVIEQGSFNITNGTTIDSTTRVRSQYMDHAIPAGTYTISASGPYYVVVYAYTTNDTSGYDTDESTTAWEKLPYTFITTKPLYLRFGFRKYGDRDTIVPSEVSNIILNAGSTTPTSYIPYGWQIPITNASVTTPLYLGDVSTTRRIKKLVLTGEETVAPYDTRYNRFSIVVSDWIQLGVRKSPLTCSHYQAIYDGRAIADVPDNSVYSDGTGTGRMFFKTTDYTDATTWKAYLAQQYASGTPVTVWYVLAEPTTGIVNEPLYKIGAYADELHITDGEVTIPTMRGQNTLTVETELQPSEMTIAYTK